MRRNTQTINRLAAIVLAAVMSIVFARGAWAGETGRKIARESVIEKIASRGAMKVGLGIFVPWSFKDKNGKLAGFEVDVARKLAKDMDVKVEFVPTEWSGIIPALLTGKFDVIIGGMGITTERAMKVNFSVPYSWSGMDLVVSQKKLPGVSSMEDLNRKDVVIAVRMGATPAAAAKKYAPKARLRQFEDDSAALQEVLNGNAHAAFSSSPTPAFWAADHPGALYRPLEGKYLYQDPISFAIRKGDPDAVFFFNAWITDNQEWLKSRDAYWFGSKDWKHMTAD
ncbi:Amino acid ABC transporter substrate-binding protein [Candidatus Desulfarcum epimagneticum]|uniref:Amino acid ABC transporter substrate-binding protein n=1 Tax=uncultured Desulfobacteraceae bacterium TaxID=218296 RepID=A0A484HFZ8_9BACT|nr:Amino acid ABC transporter substrate-binding protein [uncultured Desulfobacteraceae bacterium]